MFARVVVVVVRDQACAVINTWAHRVYPTAEPLCRAGIDKQVLSRGLDFCRVIDKVRREQEIDEMMKKRAKMNNEKNCW